RARERDPAYRRALLLSPRDLAHRSPDNRPIQRLPGCEGRPVAQTRAGARSVLDERGPDRGAASQGEDHRGPDHDPRAQGREVEEAQIVQVRLELLEGDIPD